jgi:hypothetical protein
VDAMDEDDNGARKGYEREGGKRRRGEDDYIMIIMLLMLLLLLVISISLLISKMRLFRPIPGRSFLEASFSNWRANLEIRFSDAPFALF